MNLFAILYCFPPLLVPATMCYVKLLVGLREHGYKIDVLTINPESFAPPDESFITDEALLQLIPDGIINHKIWSWENNRLIKLLKESRISNNLFYRWFQPRKREWTFSAINYLKKIDINQYDVILSCSQPHCNHLIGYYLKEKTGKPWIAYFSDPWTDNPYTIYPSDRIYRYNLELEKMVIENADKILFTSEEMVRLVMTKYSDKVRERCDVLPHSFIPEWYDLVRTAARRDNGKISIAHTGHFYGPRTPLPILNALENLSRDINLSEKMEISFYGFMDSKYRDLIRDRRMDSFIKIKGTVPYINSLALIKNSDYLLLIDAPLKNESESVFLPSKLIDYIGSYQPVIGITPENGTSARVLRQTGNISCDIQNGEVAYDVFKRLVDLSLIPKPDKGIILKYHFKKVTSNLVKIIKKHF
jgi:glycosyltransferase involved in cell wall biosynthesis